MGIARSAAVLACRSRFAGSSPTWSTARCWRTAHVGRVATHGASRSESAVEGGGSFKCAVERREGEEGARHERFSEGAFGVAVRSDRWIYRLLSWRDTFRVVGGIIELVVVLAPYVLRFVGIVLIVVLAIWGLGKLVTCAQQKKFGVYYYRCENDIMLSLFDGEIMSSNESE